MKWLKLDSQFDSNPKAIAAGYTGRTLFLWLLRVNARRDFEGEIPQAYCAVEYIVRDLGMPERDVAAALALCVDARLVHREPSGSLTLIGWGPEWMPDPTAAARKRAQRVRDNDVARLQTDVTVSHSPVTDVTVDKKRKDKIREDPPPSPPPGGSPAPHMVRAKLVLERFRANKLAKDKELAEATATVAADFNKRLLRSVHAKGWEKGVARVLAAGYSLTEIRGAIWWAGEEWRDDERMRKQVSPTTILKLTSSAGSRCFPEYLALANERWQELNPSKPCPWAKENPNAHPATH